MADDVASGDSSDSERELSDNSDSTSPPVARSRKRLRHEESWGRNKRKRLRNAGKMYVSSKGVVVPPRLPGNDCKCSLHCFKKISNTDRSRILDEFNSLQTFNVQNAYIHGLIKRSDPKRRYTSKGASSTRKNKFSYFVRLQGKEIRVCYKAFCSIHGISAKRVRSVRVKDCTPPLDQRGSHDNRPNLIPEPTIDCVKKHILSFPRQMSHYSRNANPNKRYLSPELNITRMHRLYLQKCDELVWPSVTESTYRKVFCEDFNFSFGSPRSDTCKVCDTLNCHIKDSTDVNSKAEFMKELETHHDVAELGFESLRTDTQLSQDEPTSHLVMSFDLEQNLPTPHIHTSLVFYLRQLWVYNLGIHNVSNGNGYMCMWPENVARRGSDEIASCLLKYFRSLTVKPKHLIAYSDSCGGQNKNFYMICFWVYVVLKGLFECVDHKFLTPGHTYLPSDRDFALIEKKKRESEVYVPNQWYNLVEQTRRINPFTVFRMNLDEFKNLKTFSKNFVNRKKNAEKEKLCFQKISWFRISKHDPAKILIRYTLKDDEPWKTWNIGKAKVKLDSSVLLVSKYNGDIPINSKKVVDLMKMKSFIPEAYHPFYNNLISVNADDDTDAEFVFDE